MYDHIMVIGDIHGKWDRFMSLYQKINFNPAKDFLIFLGDYIDRGEKPLHVLDWMYEHRKEKSIVMLRGNHEQMMLNYYHSGGSDHTWLWNGGNKLRKALEHQPPRALEECLRFLDSLPLYHRMDIQGKDYFFCHAGILPNVPLEKQSEKDLLWIREDFYKNYNGSTTVVVGHTPMFYLKREPVPWIMSDRNIIMMDTGSFVEKGCISCMDLISGKIWQSEDPK